MMDSKTKLPQLLFRRDQLSLAEQASYADFPPDFNHTKWGQATLSILRSKDEIKRYIQELHPDMISATGGFQSSQDGQEFSLDHLYWSTSGVPCYIDDYLSSWRTGHFVAKSPPAVIVPPEDSEVGAILRALVEKYTKMNDHSMDTQTLWELHSLNRNAVNVVL